MQLRKAFFSTSSMTFGAAVTVMAVAMMVATPADAARKRKSAGGYSPPASAIVIDANSGRTLYADDAEEARYPASLTKMMTLYILFDEIDRGRVKLDTPMRASANAAAQPPSKLGLRPGDTIEAEDAIKALVTRSANDVAVVIGEHIEGSESAFAARMTRTARSLGMSNTTFRNASGLPDPQQRTTAHDLATLAIALREQHPRHFGYFATRSFTWKGQTIGNHNRLVGRVPGVNGIKTGFIRASGFNLTTNVERDGRHLVAVVLGGRTGAARDARMRDLVEEYLPKAKQGGSSEPLVARAEVPATTAAVTQAPVPVAAPRNVLTASASSAELTEPLQINTAATTPITVPVPVASPAAASTAAAGAIRATTPTASARPVTRNPADIIASVHRSLTPAAITANNSANTPSDALALTTTTPSMRWVEGAKPANTATPEAAKVLLASAVATPEPNAAKSTPTPARRETVEAVAQANVPESVRTGWLIQIGATDAADKAQDLLDSARSKAGGALARAEPFTESVQKGEQTLYRARFGGFNERTAQAACKALKTRDIACFTIRN